MKSIAYSRTEFKTHNAGQEELCTRDWLCCFRAGLGFSCSDQSGQYNSLGMQWRYGVVVVQFAGLNESGVQKSCSKWAQFL